MSTSRRSASFHMQNNGNSTRRSPRRLRTKTPSANELSKKLKVSPKGKRKLEFQNQKEKVKPLKGKRFYLDLHYYRKTARLCEDIKQLGGTVEEFLSKDVTFVITDSKEVDQKCSPRSQSTPSPGMFNPSPSLLNKSVDSPQNAEEQQTVKKHTRGQAFVNRSLSQTVTNKSGSGNVLSNARLWDVTVVRLEKLLEGLCRYLKPGKTTSLKTLPVSEKSFSNKSLVVKVRKLQVPFIKVEDHSRQYRPLVHELKQWPKAWFDSPPGWCPFDHPPHIEDKEQKAEKLKSDRKQLKKDSKKIKESTQEPKKKKKGYCECCCLRYEDLDQHLKSENHKTFAKNSSNYSSLDQLIARGCSLKDLVNDVQQNVTPQTPERSKKGVLPECTTPQTPANGEYVDTDDEKVSPRTRAQFRASAGGSPYTISETLENKNQKEKKEITEQSGAGDLPARRIRSSNAKSPEKKSAKSINSHNCRTHEQSKSNRNCLASRSSKKEKSVSSDGGSSKENYDPSPRKAMQTSDSLEPETKNNSTSEVSESNASESSEHKNLDKQSPKPVAGEKNGVEKEDDVDDSHSDSESADEVRYLRKDPLTQTPRRKSFLKKKESTKTRYLKSQKKQKDGSSALGVRAKVDSLDQVTLQTASVIKEKKSSTSLNYIALSSDETESIRVPSSVDSFQNSSHENTFIKDSSTSTITLPREDSFSEYNEASQQQFRVKDLVGKSQRKRLATSYKKDRSKVKCTVGDRSKKLVPVKEYSLQTKQNHKKAQDSNKSLCPENVVSVIEKGVGAIPETSLQPSAAADERTNYELPSSASSGYGQSVGAQKRKAVKKKVATVDEADETILDTDVSLIAEVGNDTVRTTRNHQDSHEQIEPEVSGRRQNEKGLPSLFPSNEGKKVDKFLGYINAETQNSKKNILARARRDKTEVIVKTQVDDGQSRSDESLEPQQVPIFELSDFDEVLDDEQASFSVCIDSIVDSIQVDKSRVLETTSRPREKETSKCASGQTLSKLQELLVRKQDVESNLKDKSQDNPDYESDKEEDRASIVSDSTGEDSDNEIIEPFLSPVRLLKRKSLDLSDDEIIFKFPTKRRRTLDSTSSVEQWNEEPLPSDNEKFIETAEPRYEKEQPKPSQISSSTSEAELDGNASGSQKTHFQRLTDSEFFDFSKLNDFSFYVDITERVKLRRRKRLESVEKSTEENTVRSKLKSTPSLQEQRWQKAKNSRSASLVEKFSKSKSPHPKSKRHHLPGQNLEENKDAKTLQHLTRQRRRLASVPVRPLTCQLSSLNGADLKENTTSPPTLSPITSPSQKIMVSTPRGKTSSKIRLCSTPCSTRYSRRNLRSRS